MRSCDREKPLKNERILNAATARNQSDCTLFKVTLEKHLPKEIAEARTVNKMLTYGSVQQSYSEVLRSSEGTCEKSIQVSKSVYLVIVIF